MHQLNPFFYGKPVPPSRFIGRREILRTVFSRLNHGDSTALLGLPHFGKSSVLRYLDSPEVRKSWLGSAAQSLQVVQVDCHGLQNSAQPADLWQILVEAALERWGENPSVRQAAHAAQSAGYNSPALLTKLFGSGLGEQGNRVALLLDEVEVLLHHANFCRSEFLGLLRSLATRTDGLVLVLASRMSLTQMNRLSADVNQGSPFFNNCIEVPLAPLSKPEIRMLLDTCLAGHAPVFQPEDYQFVAEQSGGQPYLVQAMAAALFDAIDQGIPAGPAQYQRAVEALHQQVGSYFDTLWQSLDARLRQALILSIVGSQGTSDGTAARAALAAFQVERNRLRQLGLLIPPSGPEEPSGRTGELSDRIAASLAAWILDHSVATIENSRADAWEYWIGGITGAPPESDLLRALVLHFAASCQYQAAPQSLYEPAARPAKASASRSMLRAPTRDSLRQLLYGLLRTAAEMDRFCLDYFQDRVYKNFSSGMDRTARLNLLLECIDTEEILAQLECAFPQEIMTQRHLLRYQ